MRKKLLVLGFATALLWLGYALFMRISKQVIGAIWDDVSTRSYLEASHTPSIAEIEALTRMKLPKGYRDLKALSYVEPREPADDSLRVKLSAERSEIKKALAAAGLYGNLQPNPKRRGIKNGDVKIPWWNPDAEKNVLSGSYRFDPSTGQHAGKAWDIGILIVQHEKELDTLYVDVYRRCQTPSLCE